jgi:predicted nucleic acid-binding protein
MRYAFDSNVMIYAEGSEETQKRVIANALIAAIHGDDLLIPMQAAGELRRWLIGKGKLSRSEAVERSNRWIEKYATQATDKEVYVAAGELMTDHALQAWDSIVLAAAWTGGANVLLSEDMQDGFRWRGVTIANPFAEKPIQIVRDILGRP